MRIMLVHDDADDGNPHKFEFVPRLLDIGSVRKTRIDYEQHTVGQRREGNDVRLRKERRCVDKDDVEQITQLGQ